MFHLELTAEEAKEINDTLFNSSLTVSMRKSLADKLILAHKNHDQGFIFLPFNKRQIQIVEWALRRLHSFGRKLKGGSPTDFYKDRVVDSGKSLHPVSMKEYGDMLPEIEELYNSIVGNVMISEAFQDDSKTNLKSNNS